MLSLLCPQNGATQRTLTRGPQESYQFVPYIYFFLPWITPASFPRVINSKTLKNAPRTSFARSYPREGEGPRKQSPVPQHKGRGSLRSAPGDSSSKMGRRAGEALTWR